MGNDTIVYVGVDVSKAKIAVGAFDNFTQSLDTLWELWDEIVAVNLTSLYLVSNAVLPHMIEKGHGVILNIASGAGLRAAEAAPPIPAQSTGSLVTRGNWRQPMGTRAYA